MPIYIAKIIKNDLLFLHFLLQFKHFSLYCNHHKRDTTWQLVITCITECIIASTKLFKKSTKKTCNQIINYYTDCVDEIGSSEETRVYMIRHGCVYVWWEVSHNDEATLHATEHPNNLQVAICILFGFFCFVRNPFYIVFCRQCWGLWSGWLWVSLVLLVCM